MAEVTSEKSPVRAGSTAPCEFDFSSSEGEAEILRLLNVAMVLRDELRDPAVARRLGRRERLYEYSLGLAVLPDLLFRHAIGTGKKQARGNTATTPNLEAALRSELERGGGISRKMALYERTLGLAVLPVLLRRLFYYLKRSAAEATRG